MRISGHGRNPVQIRRDFYQLDRASSNVTRPMRFTGSTAIQKGQGFCFDPDYDFGDAVIARPIELPDTSNNYIFAGVAAQAYAASPGGQWILVYEPGAHCRVLTDRAVTKGQGVAITCIVGGSDAGKFGPQGFEGRGSAVPLETTAAAGEIYCRLLTGEESGLVETITAVDNGAAAAMAGGITFITGSTLVAGNSTDTLGDGTYEGQRKQFELIADLGATYSHRLTITNGVFTDDWTPVSAITFQNSGDLANMRWSGDNWLIDHVSGAIWEAG